MVRIQFECGKMWTRITPNTDIFHAVKTFITESAIEYIIITERFIVLLLWIHLTKSTFLLKSLTDFPSTYVIFFSCFYLYIFSFCALLNAYQCIRFAFLNFHFIIMWMIFIEKNPEESSKECLLAGEKYSHYRIWSMKWLLLFSFRM